MNQFVLKNRNYLLLFVGSVVSNLGTAMYNFAISLYILKITDGNAIAAGIYMMFGGIIFFALTPFAGALVDRLDKVRVVYVTDLINGFVIFVAGVAIFSGVGTTTIIIILYLCSLVLGINSSLFNPAARSLPAHILEEDQLQQSQSLQQGMYALYSILGAVFGGIMYTFVSIEWIFIINGVSFILSGISEMFINISTAPDEEHTITFKGTLLDIKNGVSYVLKFKAILSLVLIASLLNFFTVPVIVNGLPYLFEVVLQSPAIYFSIIMASFPVGVVISSFILGVSKQKESVSPMIIKGLFGMAIGFSIMGAAIYLHLEGTINFTMFMGISVFGVVFTGFANSYINVPFGVAILKSVDKNMLGRVSSVLTIISNGLTPIAMGLGGVAITYLGINNLVLFAIIAMFATAIITMKNKHISEL